MDKGDPLAGLEQAYKNASDEEHESKEIETLAKLAVRLAHYRKSLWSAGLSDDLCDKLVEEYHRAIIAPLYLLA